MKSRVLTYSREADSATLMWVKGARRSETQRQNHSWGSFQGQHGDFEGGTSLEEKPHTCNAAVAYE